MTQQEKDALQEIQGSKGWQLMEWLLQQKIASLDTVSGLDARSVDKVGIEALARQKAVTILKDFLNDMGLNAIKKETNKTYE